MKAKDLNICLFPMEIKWLDKEGNLKYLSAMLEKIHPATDLVVLPETFSTGFPAGMDKETVRPLAERNTGATIEEIKRLASLHNIAIAGSFIADSGGSLYNRAFFMEPSGDEYFADKRHLFSMAGEDKVFSEGFSRMSVRYRGWNISMVICYDIRFPAWCRNNNNEYDLMLVVANWPEVRVDAWNKLLPARAIENEAYYCAVDCKGIDNSGFSYDGSSHALDFKGCDIGVSQDDSPFIYASLSMDKLIAFREKFPAWRDADSFKII